MEFLAFLGMLFLLISALVIFLGVMWYFSEDSPGVFLWEDYECNPKFTKTANFILKNGLKYLNFLGHIGWYIGKVIGVIFGFFFLSKDGENPCD